MNPYETLGSTRYLTQGVHHRWDPIVKWTGWNNHIRKDLDMEFCSQYGHDSYSLRAINYLDGARRILPALSSLSGVFSIGNILVLVENKNCELEITLGEGIGATGYAYHISKRKRKSYLCLFGVWFKPEIIDSIITSRLLNHENNKEDLDEIKLRNISYPILYIDRITGNLYTCSCFGKYLDISHDIGRLIQYTVGDDSLRDRVDNLRNIDDICHFCKGGIPKLIYGDSMYYSSFLQRFLPYHKLLARMTYGRPVFEREESRKVGSSAEPVGKLV